MKVEIENLNKIISSLNLIHFCGINLLNTTFQNKVVNDKTSDLANSIETVNKSQNRIRF